jgi:hypothetical protein
MSMLGAAIRRDIWISLAIGAFAFLLICALSSLYGLKGIDNFFWVGMLFAAVSFRKALTRTSVSHSGRLGFLPICWCSHYSPSS